MDLFLAISQGIGVSLATGVRALPAAAACRRAGARRRRRRLQRHRLLVPGVDPVSRWPLVASPSWLAERRAPGRRCRRWSLRGDRARARRARCSPARLRRRATRPGRGSRPEPLRAARDSCRAAPSSAARAARLGARGGRGRIAALPRAATPTAAARRLAALAVFLPPLSYVALAFCVWVLLVQRRRAGAQVRGPARSSLTRDAMTRSSSSSSSTRSSPRCSSARSRRARRRCSREILRRGTYVPDCVSVFPSVTPAASASITTGAPRRRHGVPSINWYHRGEGRYVEYGSSWPATRTFGVLRTINDIVYNMNFEHLSRAQPTFFETLDDAGVRTACTPFLIFRGRTRHELALQGWMRASRVRRTSTTRSTGRPSSSTASSTPRGTSTAGRRWRGPGRATPTRDASARTSRSYDLYDFLLFSLPDNDHYSHRHGPGRDGHLDRAGRPATSQRLVDGAGGVEHVLRARTP